MATRRSCGRRWSTEAPPIATVPRSWLSSPAMIRISVDLPQPEGPTRVRNSPSATSRLMPLRTAVPSKDFSIESSGRDATNTPPKLGYPPRRVDFVDDVVDHERLEALDLLDRCLDRVRRELVLDGPEPALADHLGLHGGPDHKTRGGRPDVARPAEAAVERAVHVPARHDGDAAAPQKSEEPRARFGPDRPVAPGIALVRMVDEQRLMEKPGKLPAARRPHRLLEPLELPLLLGLAAAEEERVEPQQAPAPDVAKPVIRTEMA